MTDTTIHPDTLVRYNGANDQTMGAASTVLDISPRGLCLVGGWPDTEGSMRSRSMMRARVALIAVVTMSLVVATPAAGQSDYTFTVIADFADTDCYQISAPVLNNNGQVAFWAVCGSAFVVRRSDGGAVTPIHSWSGGSGYIPDNPVSINDDGVVAFRARDSQSTRQAILVGAGNGLTPVVDTGIHTQYRDIHFPTINASGAVAFMAVTGDVNSYDSVVVANNGSFVTIAGPGTSSSLGTLLWAAYPGRLNSSGVVTFLGQLETVYGVFTGAGGPLTTISSGGSESILNGINTSGRVSFIGLSGNQYAVQTGEGGATTTTIASNADGYFSLTGGTSINDSNKVAFWAQLNSGESGIFTGPNPETDRVIKSGLSVPELGTVTAVWQITAEALNNAGQVAFGVTYDAGDGVPKWALLRANPTNGAPVASNGTASVTAGGSVSGTLGATDPDGDSLDYAIVANGTKGTAILTNTATGAFTYTANSGVSGEDTFTFKATDNRGLDSNVATITITIEPVSACALDVTGFVARPKGKAAKNSALTHSVALENVSSSAITGPVSIALDSLTAGVTLVNSAGVTSCAAPAGSPYINVDVGADSVWSPGERVEVVLQFSVESTGAGKKAATPKYTLRVLAGAGAR